MNKFPPGHFIASAIEDAMKTLPPAGPDLPPQTVEIDARPGWGLYRVTFIVMQNPRQGMRSWFWVMRQATALTAVSPLMMALFVNCRGGIGRVSDDVLLE